MIFGTTKVPSADELAAFEKDVAQAVAPIARRYGFSVLGAEDAEPQDDRVETALADAAAALDNLKAALGR